jgi:hypothetical protein
MGHFVLRIGREQELHLLVFFLHNLNALTFKSRAPGKGYALLTVLFPLAGDDDWVIPWGLWLPSEFRLNARIRWCWGHG